MNTRLSILSAESADTHPCRYREIVKAMLRATQGGLKCVAIFVCVFIEKRKGEIATSKAIHFNDLLIFGI